MSWGPLIHGHAPPGLVKAIAGAARHGTSFGAPSPLEHALGERVRTLMPSLERVRFVSSGTEAAMSAVRVARAFTGRDKIIKFEGCYHGHADAFLAKAGSGATTLGVPTSPGVSRAVAADTLLARYNDVASVESLCRKHKGSIAALIVEPIAGNMGVVPPADGFLQDLRDVTTRHGILLVFDEVISGFRAAPGGGQAVFGVVPDLTCLGKIIGGGLPVGAYGGRADIMALVAPAGPVYQAGTLSGNPVAMTAGHWSLEETDSSPLQGSRPPWCATRRGPRRRRASLRRGTAGQCVRIHGDAVLHLVAGQRLRLGVDRQYRRVRDLLQGNARARRVRAAVAVRSMVPFGGPYRPPRAADARRSACGDESRCADALEYSGCHGLVFLSRYGQ